VKVEHQNCRFLQSVVGEKKEIMSGQVEDKHGNPIEVGDTVFTKIRGGKREWEVSPNSPPMNQ
jgi:hypothetical protein